MSEFDNPGVYINELLFARDGLRRASEKLDRLLQDAQESDNAELENSIATLQRFRR